MDIDGTDPNTENEKESDGYHQEPQIMEEDTESIYIGELDILGLEQACKTGNFDKIPDRQVDNMALKLLQGSPVHKVSSSWRMAT